MRASVDVPEHRSGRQPRLPRGRRRRPGWPGIGGSRGWPDWPGIDGRRGWLGGLGNPGRLGSRGRTGSQAWCGHPRPSAGAPGDAAAGRGVPSVDVAVAVAQVGLGYLIGALGACLVLLARDLDLARSQLAWLSAGFGGALLVAGPVGPLVLARGADRVLRGSAAVLAPGAAALALAPTVLLAEVGALLLGVGGAGIVLATPALLTGPAAARRLSRVNGVASLAGVLGPLALSGTDLLPGSGRLALLLPLPLLGWLVTWPGVSGQSQPDRPPAPPLPDSAAPGVHTRQRRAGRVFARWAAMVLAVTAEFAFAVWAAARLQDSGLTVSRAAAAAAAFPLGMATGRVAAARLLDRVPLVPVSIGLVLVGTAVLVTPANPALCTGALAVTGLGIAVLYPLTLARLMHEQGLAEAHGAALGATASGTAILAGPLLIGALAAAATLRTAFLIVIPILLTLALLQRRG